MLLAVELIKSDIGIRSDLFKFSEKITDCEKIFSRRRDFILGYKVLFICINKSVICFAAVKVAGILERNRSSLRFCFNKLMEFIDISECAAVGNNITVKVPLFAENVNKQI